MATPKDRPFMCHSSDARRQEFMNGCCKDGDFCNDNITLVLADPVEVPDHKGGFYFFCFV